MVQKIRKRVSAPKSKFVIKRASATSSFSSFNRSARKKTRNINRSNPTSKISSQKRKVKNVSSPTQKIIGTKSLLNQNNTSRQKKGNTIKQQIQRNAPIDKLRSPVSIPSGSGKFTSAVNVGNGKMQDIVFTFSQGNITDRRPLGVPVPQSRRFKEKRIPMRINKTTNRVII